MTSDEHDDMALDAALRELGDEARVTHSKSHLDAVYVSVVANLDAQKKARRPDRVTVRAGERDRTLIIDEPTEKPANPHLESWNTVRYLAALFLLPLLYITVIITVAVMGATLGSSDAREWIILTSFLMISTHLSTWVARRLSNRRKHD